MTRQSAPCFWRAAKPLRCSRSLPALAGLVVACAPFLPANTLLAQPTATLEVVVTDSATGTGIASAQVRLRQRAVGGMTDAQGVLTLHSLAPGADDLVVRFLGYAEVVIKVELVAGDSTRIAAALRRVPAELSPVAVEGGRRWPSPPGWDARHKLGLGHFITREEIERRRPNQSIDLIRTVRGVRLFPVEEGRYLIRMSRHSSGGCTPQVYVNGARILSEITDGPPAQPGGVLQRPRDDGNVTQGSVFETIHWESIDAIEVYVGASQVPPEFNTTGSVCGVILLWLKR